MRISTWCRWFLLLSLAATANAQVGRDWGIERTNYIDPVTRLTITEITGTNGVANNLYFHFPNFTADNRFLIFNSTRTGSSQVYRYDIASGRIHQLTDQRGIHAAGACPDPTHPSRVYVVQNRDLLALDVATFETKRVATVPGPAIGGISQPTLSRDGRWVALSLQRDESTWEIGRIDAETGAYTRVITQGFRIGHVQHSPVHDHIFYVWETGGFAPQRTWLVDVDGRRNRPFYAITASTNWFTPLKEWITHEAWVHDTGDMTMINDKLGVMLVKPSGEARIVREGRYWHAAARTDGKKIVIDDFDGRLWLTDTATGNTRLLATGLRDTLRVHPHPSFDRQGRFVQFHTGRTHETVALLDLTQLPPENSP